MYKYEMDPTRTVGTTEWTRDARQMDGRMDGRTDGWSETKIPPQQLCCVCVCVCVCVGGGGGGGRGGV